jgi:UDP-N-acetylglucosamine:LPS N-acetylglucosamine transferase
LNRRRFRTAVPKAAAFLDAYTPDLIISTHWACSHLFSLARQERRVPHFYIYGELGSTYSVINCGADLYFILSPRVRDGLARIGIDPAHMRQIPVIVDPHMVKSEIPRDLLRSGLGIPQGNLAVVLSLGGEGIGRTLPFLEAFARSVRGASMVVLTGRNTRLLQKIERRIKSDSVIALGYQEDVSRIFAAADVLAGKCGTGFAMIAIATGIPLIVTHLGAPNERGNMRHIVENGHGWYCPRPRQFAEQVSRLVRDRAGCREPARAAAPADAAPVDRPNGAETIAAAIVEALA